MYIEQDGDYDFCDLTLTITWENEIDSYANNKPVESINLTYQYIQTIHSYPTKPTY